MSVVLIVASVVLVSFYNFSDSRLGNLTLVNPVNSSTLSYYTSYEPECLTPIIMHSRYTFNLNNRMISIIGMKHSLNSKIFHCYSKLITKL